MNELYTKRSHRCLYLLKDKSVTYLAWPKQHFCFVCINGINEKDEPVSTLHYTERWKRKDRFSHPAPGTAHSVLPGAMKCVTYRANSLPKSKHCCSKIPGRNTMEAPF